MILSEIKPMMNRDVTYSGSTYRLIGYILRKSEKTGEFFHQAELLDKNGSSTAVCRLEDVEVQDNDQL